MKKQLMVAGLLLSFAIGATMAGCTKNTPPDEENKKNPPVETVKTYTDYDWDNMDFSTKTVKYQLTGEYPLYQGHNYEFLMNVYTDGVCRVIQNNTYAGSTDQLDAYYYGTWSETTDSELELTEVTLSIGYPGSGDNGTLLLRENKFYAGGNKLSMTGFRFELSVIKIKREDATLNGTADIKYSDSQWQTYVAGKRSQGQPDDGDEQDKNFLTFASEDNSSTVVFDLEGKITAKSGTVEQTGTWDIDGDGKLTATINNTACSVTTANGKFSLNWNEKTLTCSAKEVSNTLVGSSTFQYGTLQVSEYLFTDGSVLFKSYANNKIVELKLGTYTVADKTLTLKFDGEDDITVNTNAQNYWEYEITVVFSEYLTLDVTLTSTGKVEDVTAVTAIHTFTGKWNNVLDCTITLYSNGTASGVAIMGGQEAHKATGTWEMQGSTLKITMDGVGDVSGEGDALTFGWTFALRGNDGTATMTKTSE